ncbi:MAG: hypothetical protein D6746_16675, partial [Bacteroidetes bacterium]
MESEHPAYLDKGVGEVTIRVSGPDFPRRIVINSSKSTDWCKPSVDNPNEHEMRIRIFTNAINTESF